MFAGGVPVGCFRSDIVSVSFRELFDDDGRTLHCEQSVRRQAAFGGEGEVERDREGDESRLEVADEEEVLEGALLSFVRGRSR